MRPTTIRCGSSAYSFIQIENIGSNDKSLRVSAEVLDTNIVVPSVSFSLDSTDDTTKTFKVETSTLEAGSYVLRQKVSYDDEFKFEDTKFAIVCGADGGTGIIVKEPDNNGGFDNLSTTDDNTYEIFGTEVSLITLILAFSILIVFILIGAFVIFSKK